MNASGHITTQTPTKKTQTHPQISIHSAWLTWEMGMPGTFTYTYRKENADSSSEFSSASNFRPVLLAVGDCLASIRLFSLWSLWHNWESSHQPHTLINSPCQTNFIFPGQNRKWWVIVIKMFFSSAREFRVVFLAFRVFWKCHPCTRCIRYLLTVLKLWTSTSGMACIVPTFHRFCKSDAEVNFGVQARKIWLRVSLCESVQSPTPFPFLLSLPHVGCLRF